MPAPMDPGTLARLKRLLTGPLAAARAAEEARLAALMAEIDGWRARAAGLRRSIAAPAPGGGLVAAGGSDASSGELSAAARWRDRLGAEARAAEARAAALASEAEAVRARLAKAFGRERAMTGLLEKARRAARRAAERRAEHSTACSPGRDSRGADQSSSPEPEPGGGSAGSPGMA